MNLAGMHKKPDSLIIKELEAELATLKQASSLYLTRLLEIRAELDLARAVVAEAREHRLEPDCLTGRCQLDRAVDAYDAHTKVPK